MHILSMHTWTSLSNEQRSRVRYIFNIPRSSHVIVNDGRIETDGTTPQDFEHLTVEKMQVFVENDSQDFHKLFDMVLAKIQDEIEGKPPVEEVTIISLSPQTHAKAKKGSKK